MSKVLVAFIPRHTLARNMSIVSFLINELHDLAYNGICTYSHTQKQNTEVWLSCRVIIFFASWFV